jgi:hypothetical protein
MSNKTDQAIEFRRLAALQPKNSDLEVALTNATMQWEIDAKRFEDSQKLQDIGRGAFESIADMVAALECDYDRLEELKEFKEREGLMNTDALDELRELQQTAGECTSREEAEQRIMEDPLSIEVRGGWVSYGEQDRLGAPTEFKILLGTGGPATQIRGELDEHGEPVRAWVEAQDWFTPWTEYVGGDSDTLLTYCRCFYFGEG